MSSANINIKELLQLCLKRELCFASYREPSGEIKTVIQRKGDPLELDTSHEITDLPGFLISPYHNHGSTKPLLIAPDVVVIGDEVDGEIFSEVAGFCGGVKGLGQCREFHESDFDEYVNQVDRVVAAIEEGRFEKVVLSRIKVVEGDQRNKLVSMFLQMCDKYPFSLIYMFQAGEHLWIGATPEILVSIKDDVFKTVSLAATRMNLPANQDIRRWSSKERQEQQYVTDYITELLGRYEINSVEKGETYLRRASNLLHLCTEFTGKASEVNGKLTLLLKDLHPTPAVCGIPKEDVQDFLAEVEEHERQYYSGFLGPVNIDKNQIALYVNLRCMRVCTDHSRLYVGGGLTSDSVPEAEWSETVLKAKTILSVLHG